MIRAFASAFDRQVRIIDSKMDRGGPILRPRDQETDGIVSFASGARFRKSFGKSLGVALRANRQSYFGAGDRH